MFLIVENITRNDNAVNIVNSLLIYTIKIEKHAYKNHIFPR